MSRSSTMHKPAYSTKLFNILAFIASIVNIFLLTKYALDSLIYENREIITNDYDLTPYTVDESRTLLNLNDFEYLISKPKCNDNNTLPYFVTLVHSTPIQFERRNAIRETFAHSDPRTITYFLMGKVNNPSVQKQILDEDVKYNDVIQGNFIDSYHNLTYKHVMGLKWFTYNCPHVKYVVKIDDDVFMNTPSVTEFLKNNKNERNFLMGLYRFPEKCLRTGKWKITPEQLSEDYYPEYVLGQSAIYSSDFVIAAYKKSHSTRFYWVDDVFVTGMLRMQLNVKITPIYDYILIGKPLEDIYNGSTYLPEPIFMFSSHGKESHQIRTLWNRTESYRLQNTYFSDKQEQFSNSL